MAENERDERAIYVARKSFYAFWDERRWHVRRRQTGRLGHPLVENHPDFWRPLVVDYDLDPTVEQATAAPGEKRTTRFLPAEEPRPEGVRHVGGGIFETPDGERHRGRAAAEEHLNRPDTPADPPADPPADEED